MLEHREGAAKVTERVPLCRSGSFLAARQTILSSIRKGSISAANTKRFRNKKKQLGQFMTPPELAAKIVAELELTETSHILEPSFGEGAFLFAVIEKLLTLGTGTQQEKLKRIFTSQLYGVEIDEQLYTQTITQRGKLITIEKGLIVSGNRCLPMCRK